MKVKNIAKATESELYSYYLSSGVDDIMSFSDYLERVNAGTVRMENIMDSTRQLFVREIQVAGDNAVADAIVTDIRANPDKYKGIDSAMILSREDVLKYLKLGIEAARNKNS